ncbi:MAG TPA: hypothetical protein VK481_13685, partial [Gemmatimonadaceae bacterium]|nr:hypothetical protein [Gemmatimonadaceae bacterium]
MPTRATSSLSLLVFGAIALAALPVKTWSQGGPPPPAQSVSAATDSLVEVCYVASSGVVYLIKAPGLRAFCATQRHVYLSWRISGGPVGPAGAVGAVGAAGPIGPA